MLVTYPRRRATVSYTHLLRPTCGAEWAARVRTAADEAGLRIDALLAAGSGRTMLSLARAVASATRGPLVLGASNPVRAFDLAVESLEMCIRDRGLTGEVTVGVCRVRVGR